MASVSNQNHLLIIEDDKGQRKVFLERSIYSIGRERGCDICLSSQFVSRQHATLVRQVNKDGSFFYRIQDGNLKGEASANGLLINGHKLQAHNLRDKDVIVFGPKVQALYFLLEHDSLTSVPLDDPCWDSTLIDPKMVAIDSED